MDVLLGLTSFNDQKGWGPLSVAGTATSSVWTFDRRVVTTPSTTLWRNLHCQHSHLQRPWSFQEWQNEMPSDSSDPEVGELWLILCKQLWYQSYIGLGLLEPVGKTSSCCFLPGCPVIMQPHQTRKMFCCLNNHQLEIDSLYISGGSSPNVYHSQNFFQSNF